MTIGRAAILTQDAQRARSPATTAVRASAAASRTRTSTASAPRCRRRRQTGRLTLRPNSVVAEVLYDPRSARARGVRVIDAVTMQDTEFNARVVFLCASTIESVRLLLNSKSTTLPRRARELERHARPLRDGPPLRLGRVGDDAGLPRQAHDRPPSERHLHRAVPQREDAASGFPARLRHAGRLEPLRLGTRRQHAGLRRGVQAVRSSTSSDRGGCRRPDGERRCRTRTIASRSIRR